MPIYNIIKEGEAKHNKTIKEKPNVDAFGNVIINKDFDEKRMKNQLGTNVTRKMFGDKYVDTLSLSMNSDDLLQQIIEISPEIIDKSKLELIAAAEDTVKAFEDYMYNLVFLNANKLGEHINNVVKKYNNYFNFVGEYIGDKKDKKNIVSSRIQELHSINDVFAAFMQEVYAMKNIGIPEDQIKRFIMENYFSEEWLTQEGCKAMLNARIKHSQMIDKFLRTMLKENYELLNLNKIEAAKLAEGIENDDINSRNKLASILKDPKNMKQFRVGNNYDLSKLGGGWILFSADSNLHSQMGRLSKFLLRSINYDCIVMSHGIGEKLSFTDQIRSASGQSVKNSQKFNTWRIQPVKTPGGKTFNEIIPLIDQLSKEGFKNILIQACNPGNFSIDRHIKEKLPKDVTVKYGGYSALMDQAIISESTYNNFISLDKEIGKTIRITESNLKNICREIGTDYYNDQYFEECLREADILLNNDILVEGIADKAIGFIKSLAKKAVDIVIAIFKLLIKFFKAIWEKISGLFKNSKIVKNIDQRLKEPVEVFGITIEGAKVVKSKANTPSEIQDQILKACASINKAISRESDKQIKFANILRSTIEKGNIKVQQQAKQESARRYSNMPIYSIHEDIENDIKNPDAKRVSKVELDQKSSLGSIFDALSDPDLNNDISSEIRKYVPYPEVEKFFVETFDYKDQNTRRQLISMNEVDHNSILTSLTSKLYDQIVSKTHHIDYGDIPKTKGDITKLTNFDSMIETLGIIKGIVKEYKQDPTPVDTISVAISNIQARKDMFERAFRYDCEFPMLMYNNVVMAIVASISFMITASIEFIKAPKDESFTIQLDKVSYNKSKDGLLYSGLEKFNKACQNGDFDKAMNMIIDKRVKKFIGGATGIMVGAAIITTLLIITNIIPILRELTYMFYYIKVSINDFFDVQADLLTMNAYNLQHNDTFNEDEKKEIVEKQMKIATTFRAIANKFAIDYKKAEVQATKDIEKTGKKYKLDNDANIVADDEDDSSDSSVLF